MRPGLRATGKIGIPPKALKKDRIPLKEAFLNCFQVNSGVKRWRGAVLGTYSGGIFIFGARTVEHMKNTVALLF